MVLEARSKNSISFVGNCVLKTVVMRLPYRWYTKILCLKEAEIWDRL